MAHSENKKPLFGKGYTQHYDDSGNKIGKSFDKKNLITNKVKKIHTDQNNIKIGSSENVKDAFTGKTHIQHFDQDGNPTSYTESKKTSLANIGCIQNQGKREQHKNI